MDKCLYIYSKLYKMQRRMLNLYSNTWMCLQYKIEVNHHNAKTGSLYRLGWSYGLIGL